MLSEPPPPSSARVNVPHPMATAEVLPRTWQDADHPHPTQSVKRSFYTLLLNPVSGTRPCFKHHRRLLRDSVLSRDIACKPLALESRR